MSEKQRPGVVPTMGVAPDPRAAPDLPSDLPMEIIVHSSNIQIGETAEGQVVFSLLTPVGIKITVPFPKQTWHDICKASIAPHVAVAPPGWKP